MLLMKIKDVMQREGGQVVLTGPLLLMGFSRRSEVEQAFGKKVLIATPRGDENVVDVKGVSISQSMSYDWQVSVLIEQPINLEMVALESSVSTIN